jgi:hypothetical protein
MPRNRRRSRDLQAALSSEGVAELMEKSYFFRKVRPQWVYETLAGNGAFCIGVPAQDRQCPFGKRA